MLLLTNGARSRPCLHGHDRASEEPKGLIPFITSNIKLSQMPGNITLEKGVSGLDKTSVINFSQITTIDRTRLIEQISMLPQKYIEKINESIKFIFDA